MIHRNLRFILLCQTADFLLRGLIKLLCTLPARIFTNNIFWYESNIFALQFFFFATITFRMLLGHVIVLERLLATIYASCYENYRGNTFSLVWFPIVVSWLGWGEIVGNWQIFVVLWNSFSQMEALMQNKQAMSNKSTMVTLGTFYAATLLSFIEIGVTRSSTFTRVSIPRCSPCCGVTTNANLPIIGGVSALGNATNCWRTRAPHCSWCHAWRSTFCCSWMLAFRRAFSNSNSLTLIGTTLGRVEFKEF